MSLAIAIVLTLATIVLDQALRAHRLPHHDFLLRHEIVNPRIYDQVGRRLLWPTLVAALGAAVAWGVVLLR